MMGRLHLPDQLLQRVREKTDRIPTRGPLSRADAREWAQAESLSDLGELTARWLEGDIGTRPGYYGRPAPETEELIPSLVALNRSGFLTYGSQPGLGPFHGVDGDPWWQRAAVDGFTDPATAERMNLARSKDGLLFVQHHGAGPLTTYWDDISITASEGGKIHSDSGAHLSRRQVSFMFDGIAYDDLKRAEQVAIVDPEWGRNDVLWPTISGVPALERSAEFQRELGEPDPDVLERLERWDQPERHADPLVRERDDDDELERGT